MRKNCKCHDQRHHLSVVIVFESFVLYFGFDFALLVPLQDSNISRKKSPTREMKRRKVSMKVVVAAAGYHGSFDEVSHPCQVLL